MDIGSHWRISTQKNIILAAVWKMDGRGASVEAER